MINFLLILAGLGYLFAVALLFIYGLNFLYLTRLGLARPADPTPPLPDRLPAVTVQLPIYNELYVAERLIRAAARLDYPRELLEIQVLDDSTDETAGLISRTVRELCARGLNIHHIRRANREGYKAGALSAGLEIASGEFLAIFDADFVPPADFLKRSVPFFDDPRVGFVQARWDHLNRDYSLLTRLQALAIDAHFTIEQAARSAHGYWFNFNGTAGVWRKAAVVAAGGWKADTLTEDLDLSYRSFLHGWKAVYLRDLAVPAELPASFNAYRRQQQRWARGSLECALRLIPQVWRSPIPLRTRLQSTLHLTGYFVHILLLAMACLYLPVLLLSSRYPHLVSALGLGVVFNITALAPTIMFAAAQEKRGRGWLRQVPQLLFLTVLGCGMMVNTARAAWQVLTNRPGRFERTPKYGIDHPHESWTRRTRYHLKIDSAVFAELLLAAWCGVTTGLALHTQNWAIAFYAALFCAGLLYVAGVTIWQALSVRRQSARTAVQEG